MDSETLMLEIREYCRRFSAAETTFGRLAINDGKLVSRLRYGGRVTPETADRVHAFITKPPLNRGLAPSRRSGTHKGARQAGSPNMNSTAQISQSSQVIASDSSGDNPKQNFRFYDNRQKYLMFVNTCSEKRVVAERVTQELANIHPRPPALRVFDAGIGDGTVLSRVMRSMHQRFETLPFDVVGK